jgi:hypothetical protein
MELGRRAVEALMTTIEHPDRQGVEIHIPTYLVIRGSTAPARAPRAESLKKPPRAKGKVEGKSSKRKAKKHVAI